MLEQSRAVEEAVKRYDDARRLMQRYYSPLTRTLSPLFQSDGWMLGALRDLDLPMLCWFPPTRTLMLHTAARGGLMGVSSMPIYEYECDGCRKTFEKLERSMSAPTSDAKPPKCPTCDSTKTKRKLSAFAAVASSGKESGRSAPMPGGCGRCGGPNPCGMN